MNWVSVPAVAMAAVSFYVGFSYLWLFTRRPRERENLAFAFTCFSIALYDLFCAGLYHAASPGEGMFWQRLQLAALPVFTISLSWFVYYMTRRASRVPFIVITAWLAVMAAAGLAIQGELTLTAERPFVKVVHFAGAVIRYQEVDPGIIHTLQFVSMIIAAAYLFYILIKSLLGDDPFARTLLVSLVPFFAASVNDILVGAGVYPFIYLMEYAYMFILVSMAYVLQNRFIELNREVEELTHQLEEKVNERTMELLLSEITKEIYADRSQGTGSPDAVPSGSSVSTLSQDISIISNIDRLLSRALEKAMEISGSGTGCLFIVGDDGALETAARVGMDEPGPVVREEAFRLMGKGEVTRGPWAGSEGRTVFIPVALAGDPIGICVLRRAPEAGDFSEHRVRLAVEFITQAAAAIENAFLYQRMLDRTAAARRHSITPAIEEKMKKAMAYIRENYTSDISREGLASSLNMHPDSFGRFFKMYTNMRISEFINELRVRHAAERLRGTDATIIDIAFAAGFESLPTFNRAFMKVFRVTPTRYREKGG